MHGKYFSNSINYIRFKGLKIRISIMTAQLNNLVTEIRNVQSLVVELITHCFWRN